MNRQDFFAKVFMGNLALSMVFGFFFDTGRATWLIDRSRPFARSMSGNLEPFPNIYGELVITTIIIVLFVSFVGMVTPPKEVRV